MSELNNAVAVAEVAGSIDTTTVDRSITRPPTGKASDLQLLSSGSMCRMLLARAACAAITSNEAMLCNLPVADRLQLSALARGVTMMDDSGSTVPPETQVQRLRDSHEHHGAHTLPFLATAVSPSAFGTLDVLRRSLSLRIEIAQLLAQCSTPASE